MTEITGKCNIKCLLEERFKLNYYPPSCQAILVGQFSTKTLKKGAQGNTSKTV